jgi:TonB family protein
MKILATIILALCSLYGASQPVTKYYDDSLNEVSADKAVYYVKFIKDKDMYQGTTYWKDDNALKGKGTYTDATLSSPDGTVVTYDKKGRLEDSIFYSEGKIDFSYRYYPNGQVAVHYHLPTNKTVGITETFDESGKKITNFIMAREAEFKGGESAWQAYLKKSIDKDFAVRRDKDGTFPSAEVAFTIDEEGQVTNPKITRSSGFKNVDKDALRVISDSPKWSPAISYNKAIKANKVQTVMYDPGK